VSAPRDQWKEALRPLADCVAIERFGEILEPEELGHIASCARCHAEMELWQRFNDEAVVSEEEEAVRWIVDEVARRASGNEVKPIESRRFATRSATRFATRFATRQGLLAAAAMLLVALGVGYVIDNREPSIDVPAGPGLAYRSTAVQVIAPMGDVAVAPTQLEWTAFPGATDYDVQIVEVDGTNLWRASTREPRIELPPEIRAQLAPSKTVLWEVKARRDATVLAESGTQKFRVALK